MFKRVYIEITNRCNLNCSFCRPHQRKLEEMSTEQFAFILKQLRGLTQHLYLHVKGEPLLHSQLDKLLALCQEYGFAVNLTTNGTLLMSRQELLLQSPALRQVNISVHSFPEQAPAQQEEYLNDILNFAELAASKVYVNLRFWNRQDNQPSPETAELLTTIIQHFSKEEIALEQIIQRRQVTLAKNIFLSFDDEFEWPALSNPYYGTDGTCYGLRQQLAILVDGTVVPCCLDGEGEAALGNIFITPLTDLLQTSVVQEAITGFQQYKRCLPLCQHCSYQQRFGKKG